MDTADFIIMGAVAYWYFQRTQVQNHTCKSLTLFKYHIGTIAFGSLITALILVVRIILEYVDSMTKSAQKEPGAIGKLVITCCKCCLYCFQKFIQFLNKKAYIQTIMTSKSFCPAAKEGLFLVLRNPLRVGITSGLGMVF